MANHSDVIISAAKDGVNYQQSGTTEALTPATLQDVGGGGGGGFDSSTAVHIGETFLFVAVTSVCIIMTLVGNILVILSVFTYRPLRSVQNFYIVSLAVADILVAVCVMPFHIIHSLAGSWIFGEIVCNVFLTFDILMCTASILNLCAIAIDRYYAIHDPINYAQKRTNKRVMLTIFVMWLVSIVISVPPLLGWNNSSGRTLYDPATHDCRLTDEPSFVIYSAMGSFFIPLVVMTFIYIKIFIATRNRLRKRAKAAMLHHSAPTNAETTRIDTHHNGKENIQTERSSSDNSPDATTSFVEQREQSLPAEGVDTELSINSGEITIHTCAKSINGLLLPHAIATTVADTDAAKRPKGAKGKQLSPRRGSASHHEHSIQHFMMEKQRISLSKERRAARTMSIIMGVFVLCWLPFFLIYIIVPFCGVCAEAMDGRIITGQ